MSSLRGVLLACCVGAVLAATLLGFRISAFGLRVAASAHATLRNPQSPISNLPEAGWYTFANGDDARTLALDGDQLWVGSAHGGVVVWDVARGSYEQYLRPQVPLAGNHVRDIVLDQQGNRWFATDRGISVLASDGRTWITYTRANTGGRLPSDDVTALALAPNGVIWVGTTQYWDGVAWTGGGVARFSGQGWDGPYTTANALASNAVTDLAVDPVTGDVWVTTVPQYAYIDGRWRPSLDSGGISAYRAGQWRTWAHRDGEPTSFPSTNSIRAVAIEVVDQARRHIWFATCGRGLNVLEIKPDSQAWMQFAAATGKLPADYVLAIAVERPGRIWAATASDCGFQPNGRGLARLVYGATLQDLSDDEWQHYGIAEGLPTDLVRSIAIAGIDRLWVGTADLAGEGMGVSELNLATGTVRTLAMAEQGGFPSNLVTAINFAPDGQPWIGTAHRGIAVFDGDHWQRYTRANTSGHLPSDDIRGIAFDEQGDAWVATAATEFDKVSMRWVDGGVTMFDGLAWSVPYTLENTYRRANNFVATVSGQMTLLDVVPTDLAHPADANRAFANGYLMFEGDNKLYTYVRVITGTEPVLIAIAPPLPRAVPVGTRIYSVELGLASNWTTAIAVGGGKVWVGTGSLRDRSGGGLSSFDIVSKTWQTIRYPTIASNLITGLAYDHADQRLGVAATYTGPTPTGGGLSILQDGTWLSYSGNGQLRAYLNDVRAVALGPAGQVWAGAFDWNGPPHQLPSDWQGIDAVVNRLDGSWSYLTFPGDGYISSIALDAFGTAWAGTSRDGKCPGDGSFQPKGYYAPVGGVKVIRGNQASVFNVANSGLVSDDVRVVAIDDMDRRWFGTNRGLSIFRQPYRFYLPWIEVSPHPS